jgi:hypothetical protein
MGSAQKKIPLCLVKTPSRAGTIGIYPAAIQFDYNQNLLLDNRLSRFKNPESLYFYINLLSKLEQCMCRRTFRANASK